MYEFKPYVNLRSMEKQITTGTIMKTGRDLTHMKNIASARYKPGRMKRTHSARNSFGPCAENLVTCVKRKAISQMTVCTTLCIIVGSAWLTTVLSETI